MNLEKLKNQFAYIKPGTKLFHVTESTKRQSILKNGLMGKLCTKDTNEPKVFANVGNEVSLAWWPFCFDETYSWSTEERDKFNKIGLSDKEYFEYKLQEYDYWEINYINLNRDWFIDYATKNYGFVEYFLYTIGNIAPEFLTLHFYKKQQPVIIHNNGVANIQMKGGLVPAKLYNFNNNIRLNPVGYISYNAIINKIQNHI